MVEPREFGRVESGTGTGTDVDRRIDLIFDHEA